MGNPGGSRRRRKRKVPRIRGTDKDVGSCIICGNQKDINTVMQRDEDGYWVGVVFACPECVLTLSGNILWLSVEEGD